MVNNNVTSSSRYRFQKELCSKNPTQLKESYLQVKKLGLSSKEILRNLRSKKS